MGVELIVPPKQDSVWFWTFVIIYVGEYKTQANPAVYFRYSELLSYNVGQKAILNTVVFSDTDLMHWCIANTQ